MKTARIRLFSYAVAIMLSVLTSAAREVALPMELEPLKGDILEQRVWDFSRQWLKDDKAKTKVRLYGDSLIAETYNGRRFWYSTFNDSVSFLGEEDLLTSIYLHNPAFVSPAPLTFGIDNRNVEFEASGQGGGRKFDIFETGELEFASCVSPGRLILAYGDTVVALRPASYIAQK